MYVMIPIHSMSRYGSRGPRPAGESDESESDYDDLDFDYGGGSTTSSKRNKRKYVALPHDHQVNGNVGFGEEANASANGDDENWENIEQKERTPAECVRQACIQGDLEELKELLSTSYQVGINRFFGGTEENPLILASLHANLEVIKFLLKEKEANPNLKHPGPKITPLLAVVASDKQEEELLLQCAKVLVEAGADVNSQDQFSMTPLMHSIKRKRIGIAKYLIEKGADPNITESEGRTALFYAATDGEGPLCRLLLEHGADIHIVDRYGWGAADLAQERNFEQLANLLYIVRNTKWRPGLHPELMNEMDCAVQESKVFEKFSMKEDMAMETLLASANGERYLKNFKEHQVSYLQFLLITDDQLKDIGVKEVGIREKLLENIKKIHCAEWQGSSLQNIRNIKAVSAGQAFCMLININEHLEYIACTINYLADKIRQNPLDLRIDLERNRIDKMIKVCNSIDQNSSKLKDTVLALDQVFQSLRSHPMLQIAGQIPQRKVKSVLKKPKKKRFPLIRYLLYGGIGGMSVAILFKMCGGLSSWRK